jgi:hypothetical protein
MTTLRLCGRYVAVTFAGIGSLVDQLPITADRSGRKYWLMDRKTTYYDCGGRLIRLAERGASSA